MLNSLGPHTSPCLTHSSPSHYLKLNSLLWSNICFNLNSDFSFLNLFFGAHCSFSVLLAPETVAQLHVTKYWSVIMSHLYWRTFFFFCWELFSNRTKFVVAFFERFCNLQLYYLNVFSVVTEWKPIYKVRTRILQQARAAWHVSSTQTCHVRPTTMSHQTDQYEPHVANSETNQVERLFPEFFIRCCDTTLAETNTIKTFANRKLIQRLDEPLIQSWLNLYSGGLHD